MFKLVTKNRQRKSNVFRRKEERVMLNQFFNETILFTNVS